MKTVLVEPGDVRTEDGRLVAQYAITYRSVSLRTFGQEKVGAGRAVIPECFAGEVEEARRGRKALLLRFASDLAEPLAVQVEVV